MDKPENVEINKIKYLSTLNPQKLWITSLVRKSAKNIVIMLEKWIMWITLWITVESYKNNKKVINNLCTICLDRKSVV